MRLVTTAAAWAAAWGLGVAFWTWAAWELARGLARVVWPRSDPDA